MNPTFFLPARLLLGHFTALMAAEMRQMLLYKITQEHTSACCFQHLENLTFKYANILWHAKRKKERKSWKVTFEKKHTRDVSKLEFTLLDYNYTRAITDGEHGMGCGLPRGSLPESSPSCQHLPAGGQSCVCRCKAPLSLTKAPAHTKGRERMQQRSW